MTLRELVKNITSDEVDSQTFAYIPKNWTAYAQLPGLLSTAGYSAQEIRTGFALSRRDVRTAVKPLSGQGELALVPIWGYPGGVAGPGNRKPLRAVLDNLELITTRLQQYAIQPSPISRILAAFEIPHLGLSTLSKILYFADIKSQEGPLLIYDQMVMRALHHHAFDEYGQWPAYAVSSQLETYGRFVECTTSAAQALGCSPDVIEYALFREGQRLGPARRAALPAPSTPEENAWLLAPGFILARTGGGRSYFSYRLGDRGEITMRFGSQGLCTIHSCQLDALIAEFRGRAVVLTGAPESLQA
jgi:hypothetical protein